MCEILKIKNGATDVQNPLPERQGVFDWANYISEKLSSLLTVHRNQIPFADNL